MTAVSVVARAAHWVAAAGFVRADDGRATVLNDDTVSPGLVGSAVVLVLAIAVFFLIRSFLKQLRKVPPEFPVAPATSATSAMPEPPPATGDPTGA